MDGEREKFEAALRNSDVGKNYVDFGEDDDDIYGHYYFKRNEDGRYDDLFLEAHFQAWQARASLPSAQSQEPNMNECPQCKGVADNELERVARAIAARDGADPDKLIYESLGAANVGRATPRWEGYIAHAKAALSAMPNKHEKAVKVLREALEHYAMADDGVYQMLAGFRAKITDKDPNSIANKALATVDEIVGER